MIEHRRSIYTFLDFLGDLGGLFGVLVGIMSYIVAIYFKIFGEPIQEYLLKSLFTKNENVGSADITSKRIRNMSNKDKIYLLK